MSLCPGLRAFRDFAMAGGEVALVPHRDESDGHVFAWVYSRFGRISAFLDRRTQPGQAGGPPPPGTRAGRGRWANTGLFRPEAGAERGGLRGAGISRKRRRRAAGEGPPSS